MSLPRCIDTRLLEACDREAKACFSQHDLDELYKSNGGWHIFAYPLLPNQTILPYQINIVNVPSVFEQGTSGVSETRYVIEFAFHFPINLVQFQPGVGANTYLDHIQLLRRWLVRGGTWSERIAAELPSSPIEDPDHEDEALAELVRFEWGDAAPARGNAAIVVPVLATWQTRESKEGDVT